MNAHVMDEKAIGGSSVEGLVPAQNDARRWGLKAAGSAQKRPVEPISITRCFAMVGMLIVLAIGFASAIVLSLFVRDQMLQRDLELTAQFLRQSSIQKYANSYFLRDGDQAGTDSEVEKSFAEIMGMPGVIRANIYSLSGRVIWSSDPRAINHTFSMNPELERAVSGELVVHIEESEDVDKIKHEHIFANLAGQQFAEYYIPIRDPQGVRVIGMIELYKKPDAVFSAINYGTRLVWLYTLGGGLLTYGLLLCLVHIRERIRMAAQRQRVTQEHFDTMGEVSNDAAHAIRQPLDLIRAFAERMHSEQAEKMPGHARELIGQVERIEHWLRDLHCHSRPGTSIDLAVLPNDLLRAIVNRLHAEMQKGQVTVRWRLQSVMAGVQMDANLLQQLLEDIISIALEAMPGGGTLGIETREVWEAGVVSFAEISISDTGPGREQGLLQAEGQADAETEARADRVHRFPRKGVGMPLIVRTVGHCGGSVLVQDGPGGGTRVTIALPVVG